MTTLIDSATRPDSLHAEPDGADPFVTVHGDPFGLITPDDDPDPPQPAAVRAGYPSGTLRLYAIDGADPRDEDVWDSGVCVRQYGAHEFAQAVRDADQRSRAGWREYRVCDAAGRVWHRARSRARAAA
jgi:hypothetical protein